jgi:hypothetical protein
LGDGFFGLEKLHQHWRDMNLLQSRSRRKNLLEILELIFDREAAVTYQGHIIEGIKDGDTFTGITIQVPGVH